MPVKRSATPLTIKQAYKNVGSVPFKKGNPGRPKGAKDKGPIPKNIRASVKAICQQVATKNHDTIEQALLNGIKASPAHADRYIKLVAEYVDGRPVDTMHLNATLVQEEISSAKDRLTKSIGALSVSRTQLGAAAPGSRLPWLRHRSCAVHLWNSLTASWISARRIASCAGMSVGRIRTVIFPGFREFTSSTPASSSFFTQV